MKGTNFEDRDLEMDSTSSDEETSAGHEGRCHNSQRYHHSSSLSYPEQIHRDLHLNWRRRSEPEPNTRRLETDATRPDSGPSNAYNIQQGISSLQRDGLSNQSTTANETIKSNQPIEYEQQYATGTSSRVGKQWEMATFANKTQQWAFNPGQHTQTIGVNPYHNCNDPSNTGKAIPEVGMSNDGIKKGKQPALSNPENYDFLMEFLKKGAGDSDTLPLLSKTPDDQPPRLVQNQPGFWNGPFAAPLDETDTVNYCTDKALQESSVWHDERDPDATAGTNSVALPTFPTGPESQISSSPTWWTLENLNDTYPSVMPQEWLGYRVPSEIFAQPTIRGQCCLNIHHTLYLGVVPTTTSPDLPATLNRANDL